MKRPRLLFLVGGVLAAVAIVVVGAAVVWTLRSDDPNLLTEAPAIPTVGPAAADVSPTEGPTDTAQTVADVDLPEGVRRFVVVSGDSSAKYVVEETLSELPATAVGVSTDVTGEIYLSLRVSSVASSRASQLISARCGRTSLGVTTICAETFWRRISISTPSSLSRALTPSRLVISKVRRRAWHCRAR